MPYESELEAGIGQPRSSLRKLGDWGLSLYTCGKIVGWCHFGIKGESKEETRKKRSREVYSWGQSKSTKTSLYPIAPPIGYRYPQKYHGWTRGIKGFQMS